MAGFVIAWFETNWFALLQTGGIVAGLLFTGYAASRDNRSRKIENLLSIHDSHRTIWLQIFDDPQLLRILKPNARLAQKPVTLEERIFVNLIILHLTGVLAAMRLKVMEKPAGLDRDLKEFFALPIPAEVWKVTLQYRDLPTRNYVESLNADLNASELRPSHSRKRRKAGVMWRRWGEKKFWRLW